MVPCLWGSQTVTNELGQCQPIATLVSTKCRWSSESGDFPNSDQSALGTEQLCLPRHAGPHLVPAYIHTWVSPLFSQGSPYLQHSLSLSPYSHRSVNLCPITVSWTQTKSHSDCSIRQRSRSHWDLWYKTWASHIPYLKTVPHHDTKDKLGNLFSGLFLLHKSSIFVWNHAFVEHQILCL